MIEHDPDHPDSAERWIDGTMQALRNQVVARDAEIARLRKALEWYSDAKRYKYTGWHGDMDAPSVMVDTGHRARAALMVDT